MQSLKSIRKRERRKRRRVRYLAEYLAFRTLLCVWRALSPARCAQLATFLACVVHYVLPRKLTRYEVAQANLRQALGNRYDYREIDRLIYGMWLHLFRLLAEVAQLQRKLRLRNIHDVIEFRNKQDVVRAFCSGRPVILVSGHFGNWEIALSVFGLFGFRIGAVARELENPYLNRWFLEFRQATGHHLIAKQGCFDDIMTLLAHGGNIAVLGDQDAGSGGVFVDFFGRPASTPKTIALMALEYQALICVGYAYRLPHAKSDWVRFELGCEEVIDPLETQTNDPIGEITQRYTSALERAVSRAPDQYFWVHRRWKSVPKQRGRRRTAAATIPAPAAAGEPLKKAG